jgi:hypothetical protein
MANRLNELYEWSEETGLPLPMEPSTIIALEDEGMIVDLETGLVFENPEDGEDTFDEELEILGL